MVEFLSIMRQAFSLSVVFFPILILLIVRNKFIFKDTPISGKGKIFLTLSAYVIISANAIYLGRAYYIAYNPDFKYEEISKVIDYHLYQPSFIPSGREQSSTFHIYDQKLAGKTNAVRVFYSPSLEDQLEGNKTSAIIMLQVKVDNDFNLSNYIDHINESDEKNNLEINKIELSQVSYKSAFSVKNSFVSQVHVLKQDDVLISLISPKESLEDLIKMTDSLE